MVFLAHHGFGGLPHVRCMVLSRPAPVIGWCSEFGNELNVKTSSNPCLTSSDGSSTPTPLVSSFDFVNSDLSFWCFSCDAYLDAQAIL
ncbi:hypothetical protein CK203_109855 [Vitis vinifera]|uniref:UBP-type domain-containing protein n=1 Tax=Vitis vinifera TaxID=29760 RepID=A0A438C561_VITVI|nr:hypothetical protein CK203_109855 [Vitis vinifera]